MPGLDATAASLRVRSSSKCRLCRGLVLGMVKKPGECRRGWNDGRLRSWRGPERWRPGAGVKGILPAKFSSGLAPGLGRQRAGKCPLRRRGCVPGCAHLRPFPRPGSSAARSRWVPRTWLPQSSGRAAAGRDSGAAAQIRRGQHPPNEIGVLVIAELLGADRRQAGNQHQFVVRRQLHDLARRQQRPRRLLPARP